MNFFLLLYTLLNNTQKKQRTFFAFVFKKISQKRKEKRETDECINIFQEEEKGFGFFSFRLAAAERATRKSSELDSYIAMTTGSTHRDAYIFFSFFSSRWTSRNDERASLLTSLWGVSGHQKSLALLLFSA